MRRREFISLLGGAAAWPLAARAQQAMPPVIGIIDTAGTNAIAGFRQGLSDSGLVEGRSVAIEHRSTKQYAELPTLAEDLVRRRVTVIAALGGLPAKEAKAATTTIPIVFCVGGDPVELGLVPSLNRPGGNLTGTTFFAAQLLQKQVGILHDLFPRAPRSESWSILITRVMKPMHATYRRRRVRLVSRFMLRRPAARATSTPHLSVSRDTMRVRSSSRGTRSSPISATKSSRWRRVTQFPRSTIYAITYWPAVS